MERFNVSLLFVALIMGANSAYAGPSGSGGGGPQAANFTSSARIIAASLNRAPLEAAAYFGVAGLASLYSSAIDSTDVICAVGTILKSMRANKQMAFFDGVNTIHLDCPNYNQLDRSGPNKYVVVFHEYMRKLQLESSDYRLSSRLTQFIFPTTGKRAIEAFCDGGSKDKFQLENYLAQMIQEKSIDTESAKLLREAARNNIRWPDANARILATYLGWTKKNQYPWAVQMICIERNSISADWDDTTMNPESVLALEGASGALLRINTTYTIARGRAAIVLQNGKRVVRPDDYQPYCTFAHNTDPQRNVTITPRNVKSGNITAYFMAASKQLPAGFGVNFSITGEKNVTDIDLWMPGEIGSIERLRSVLKRCFVQLNLKELLSPIVATK